MSKRVAVLTAGRQDYGILRSVLLSLVAHPEIDMRLWAGGMHLRERFGHTIERIKSDGLVVHQQLDFISEPPDPGADSARAVASVTAAIRRERPHVLLLVGDRQETLAAAFAATIERVPIAHIHGGEETEGAIDNALRHAVTKLSHLHFVSHEHHARRIRQMGEPRSSVVVIGAPGLDNRFRADLPDRASLADSLGIALADPVVIVTTHPTTLGVADATAESRAIASAMEQVSATYVITQPNADEGGAAIRDFWVQWAACRPRVALVDALGESRFWGLLRIVAAVLGNSSSGLIEAPEAGVPAVNVGDRQRGRLRGRGVRDVPVDAASIVRALREVLQPGTKAAISRLPNTYRNGPAGPRVAEALAEWVAPSPPRKSFCDIVCP